MAIDYRYLTEFKLDSEIAYSTWLERIAISEGCTLGELVYVFCDDEYLLDLNKKYLQHDTYTDIITFDYTDGKLVSGDVFISMDRVRENAKTYEVEVTLELQRVMAHGVLHLMGFNDKREDDIIRMREKENEKMKMFHVEQ